MVLGVIRGSGGAGRVRRGRRRARLEEVVERRLYAELVLGEVEQRRQRAAVGQPRARLAQLVEERVRARLQRGQPRARRVLQQPRHQRDGVRRRARPEYLRDSRGLNTDIN